MAAFEFRMIDAPKELPEGFPVQDPADPGAYKVREAVGLLIVDAMVAYACVTASPPTPEAALVSPAFVGAFLRQDGTVITPNQCTIIARELRGVIQDGVPDEAMEYLTAHWNERNPDEPFSFPESAVRSTLVHWGFFNAIAAEHGGYRVN